MTSVLSLRFGLTVLTRLSTAQHVELPGQYTGHQRPEPAAHITLVSFGAQARVMSSIRRPKQVVFHGSDEREYDFLVKGESWVVAKLGCAFIFLVALPIVTNPTLSFFMCFFFRSIPVFRFH